MKLTKTRQYLERKVQEETGGELDDKLHPMSVVAIIAGAVAFLAVLFYAGVVTDAVIGMIESTI